VLRPPLLPPRQVADAQIELTCFQALQQQELVCTPDRIERMRLLLQGQVEREEALQQRYKAACAQRDDLREALEGAPKQQAAADATAGPQPVPV
jgi:hypothetical protein